MEIYSSGKIYYVNSKIRVIMKNGDLTQFERIAEFSWDKEFLKIEYYSDTFGLLLHSSFNLDYIKKVLFCENKTDKWKKLNINFKEVVKSFNKIWE